jgi:hypothetical protein
MSTSQNTSIVGVLIGQLLAASISSLRADLQSVIFLSKTILGSIPNVSTQGARQAGDKPESYQLPHLFIVLGPK